MLYQRLLPSADYPEKIPPLESRVHCEPTAQRLVQTSRPPAGSSHQHDISAGLHGVKK